MIIFNVAEHLEAELFGRIGAELLGLRGSYFLNAKN